MKKNYLFLLLSFSFLLLIGCVTESSIFTDAYPNNTKPSPVVNTNYGPVQGISLENTNVDFYGAIPYAKPPVGELRWKAPQQCEKWENIRDCNYFPPVPSQKRLNNPQLLLFHKLTNTPKDRTDYAPVSEDCLYLSIWAPSQDNPNVQDPAKIPVMVYIHGGYLKGGQSWYETNDGEHFARDGIICINIEFRVGIFGFYTDSELAAESETNCSGNYGLMDQIAALKWIQENIENFGGDPNNITICGESAGSTCVTALCCSPVSKGLFNKAIGESSSVAGKNPPHTYKTKQENDKLSQWAKNKLGASNIEEMRQIPAEKMYKYTPKFNGLTVDGYILTETPYETYSKGNNHEEALLNGFNLRETELLTIFMKKNRRAYYKNLEEIHGKNAQSVYEIDLPKNKNQSRETFRKYSTAYMFGFQHNEWTKLCIQNETPVYYYLFTRDNKSYGNGHFGELFYTFATVPHNKKYNEYDYELENIVHSYWTNFVKNGNPNSEELPFWPTADIIYPQVFELGDNIGPTENPYFVYFEYLEQGKVE